MIKAYLLVVIVLMSFIHTGCDKQKPQQPANKTQKIDTINQTLLLLNKSFIELENEEIVEYIQSSDFNMQQSDLGFWYKIIDKGTGPLIKQNQQVTIAFSIELLDGTICYSSDKDGSKTFVVGKFQVEKGLDECMLLLRNQAEAVCILPSFLAHGVVGDRICIPPRTPILYRIKVMNIKEI